MGHERIAPQALLKSEPQGKRVVDRGSPSRRCGKRTLEHQRVHSQGSGLMLNQRGAQSADTLRGKGFSEVTPLSQNGELLRNPHAPHRNKYGNP